ncbi:MAG: hypothetical protein ABI585_03035 [Betaproteobacteria bacterium]
MNRTLAAVRRRSTMLAAALAASMALPASAEPAKGTVTQGSRTATIQHAWLVVGPDAMDPKTMVRQLVLSSTDIGAKIKACAKMSCVSGHVDDGMTVDIGGPRLNFWVALNGQRVQYSGTEAPAALAATANDGKRLAGTLRIDKTKSGGSKVDVQFDAPLAKSFTAY